MGLIQMFYEPGKVFDNVRERHSWLLPFLAGLILFAAVYAYTIDAIGAGNITQHALDNSKFAAQMSPDQKAQAVAAASTSAGKMRNLAFAVVGYAIVMALFALMFLVIASVSGSKIKFSQALGTVSYASWPIAVLRSLISIMVIAMSADKAELDPQRLLAFNAGAFLDKATTAKPLMALASAFDLFTFASMALGAYGLSRVARITFTQALIGMVVIWAVFTALGMGLSLVF